MNILTTGTEYIIVDSGQTIKKFYVTPWEGSGSTEKKQGWNLLLSMENLPSLFPFSCDSLESFRSHIGSASILFSFFAVDVPSQINKVVVSQAGGTSQLAE